MERPNFTKYLRKYNLQLSLDETSKAKAYRSSCISKEKNPFTIPFIKKTTTSILVNLENSNKWPFPFFKWSIFYELFGYFLSYYSIEHWSFSSSTDWRAKIRIILDYLLISFVTELLASTKKVICSRASFLSFLRKSATN